MKSFLSKALIHFLALTCLAPLTACFEKKTSPDQPIRIGYPISGAIVNSQLGLTLEKIVHEKENKVPMALHRFNTGRELKIALASGQVDVIFTSEANFVVLLGEDVGAVAIGSLGSAGKMGLIVKANSPIKNIEGLAGKKIATIFGTSIHQPALEWTRDLKPPPEIINISHPAGLRAAIQTGKVDAIVDWDPYLTESVFKKQVKILKESSFDLITVSTKQYVTQNRNKISLLNTAVKEALWRMAQNPDPANKMWSEASAISPEVIAMASQANANYSAKKISEVSLAISPEFKIKLKSLADFLYQEKILKKEISLDDAIQEIP